MKHSTTGNGASKCWQWKWLGWVPAILCLFILLFPTFEPRAQGIRLEMEPPDANSNHWSRIRSLGLTNRVHTLEASTNLSRWTEIATLHDGPFSFADPTSSGLRFYRATSRARSANDDGKNQILFPEDLFRSLETGNFNESRWIKFAILLSDPNRVWFQDSARYPFHYNWAIRRLAPFAGMTRQQFDAVSLRTNNQQVVLGAVLFPPARFSATMVREFGIQFVGLDPYPAAQIVSWFRLVEAAVYDETGARSYYLPAFEQRPAAESNLTFFASQGVKVSDPNRWLEGDICYSDGWAIGRLVFVLASDISAAYGDGRLKPSDILLTDGVPAEIPFVSGIISLVPATPNSHVAILARSYRIPFLYVSEAAEQTRLRALAGREIMVRVMNRFFVCEVRAAATDTDLDPALRSEILTLKSPGMVNLTPKERLGAITTNVDLLTPADIRYVGGKAANFGLLRRTIPSNSPPAIAFSFDLWDAFMDQTLPNSVKTLREEIRDRTAGYSYPPDVNAARVTLAGIQDLIRITARFSDTQRQAIIDALRVFDPSRNIRFRSSTNVEDSEQFTGAGLYDSYSGCLSDDLDGDNSGPSICDPDERNERGVFRAIQRVYASFYNENAWLERLRFRLNEDTIGMAVLAHHSYPDSEELANGVATLTMEKSPPSRFYTAELVTQLGAVSVTNPEGGANPEQVDGFNYGFGVTVETREWSNLVPLGANVMSWQDDYLNLMNLLIRVADGYASMFPSRKTFLLDYEYKRVKPGKLKVKQVREIPRPTFGGPITPYLLNEPATYCVRQGEQDNVFASHRLKCRLTLGTRNIRLSATNLAASLYRNGVFEFREGTNIVILTNGIAAWPEAAFRLDGDLVRDSWSIGSASDRRQFTLETAIVRQVDSTASPLLTHQDFRKTLAVRYSQPMPTIDFNTLVMTTNEFIELVPCPAVTRSSLLQTRVMTNLTGLKIETSFYWPEPPRGPTAGYTAPLIEWVETRINGLTAQPMVLRGFYSQTYQPGHHNFWESFIFEPRLDPDVSADQLAELHGKNIQLIFATGGYSEWSLSVLGLDGQFRQLR